MVFPGTKLVLHKFPHPEKERDRFNTWLYAIGGDILGLENERIHKYRRVCRSHFMDKYLCRNDKLSNIAVPTLNMPGMCCFYNNLGMSIKLTVCLIYQ